MKIEDYRLLLFKFEVYCYRDDLASILIEWNKVPEEEKNSLCLKDIGNILTKTEPIKELKYLFFIRKYQAGIISGRRINPRAFSPWSSEEEKLLERHFNDQTSINEISKLLNRSESAIRIRLVKLGLLENIDGAVCENCFMELDSEGETYCKECLEHYCDNCGIFREAKTYWDDVLNEHFCEDCYYLVILKRNS